MRIRGVVAVLAMMAAAATAASAVSASPNFSRARAEIAALQQAGHKVISVDDRQHTLVMADTAIADNIDPDGTNSQFIQNQTAVVQLYDTLLGFDWKKNPASLGGGAMVNPARIHGNLVSSIVRTGIGTTAKITLRKGIKSNWGNELTADDVKWSFDRNLGRGQVARVNTVATARISSVTVTGRYTLTMETSVPNALFFIALCRATLMIYDSTEMKKHITATDPWAGAWAAEHSAGFGPYVVSSWDKGQQMTFTARKDYYGKKPYFTTVKVLAIPDLGARFSALESGDVDVVNAITPLTSGRVNAKRNKGKLKITEFNGNGQVRLSINYNVPQFKDKRVRQAIAYAIPYNDIIKNVYKGQGFVAKSIIYNYVPGGTDKYWHYDTSIDKAKALMAAAGFANGFGPIPFYYPDDRPLMEPVALAIQQALAKIGIQVSLVKSPSAVLQARIVQKKDLEMSITDQGASVNPGLGGQTSTWITGSAANSVNYPDTKTMDAIHSAATTTLDPKKLLAVADDFQKLYEDELPLIVVLGFNETYAMSTRVEGWSWHPDKSPRFITAYAKQ